MSIAHIRVTDQEEIILEYKDSILHLDNKGNLSIRPKGLLLMHCTLQETLEQVEEEEETISCDR